MPLDTLGIQHFHGGIAGALDDRDIPPDAASYAEWYYPGLVDYLPVA